MKPTSTTPAPTSQIPNIVVVGSTLWSAAIARAMAAAEQPVTFVNTSARNSGHGLIRQRTLLDHGIATERKTYPVGSITLSSLSEFDAIDATFTSERLTDLATRILIVDRQSLVEAVTTHPNLTYMQARQIRPISQDGALTGVQIGREQTIKTTHLILTGTASAAAGDQVVDGDQLDPARLILVTEVGWADHSHEQSTWTEIRGDFLLDGSATLLTSPGGTYLTATIGMDCMLARGGESRDLIQEMIDHPRFVGIIPTTHPSHTANFVIPARAELSVNRDANGIIDLSSFAGLLHPVELDLDLTLGIRMGTVLADLFHSQDLSLIGLSRLQREARKAVATRQPLSELLDSATNSWTTTNPDRLFASLF